mmetsp:Transcript_16244/g.38763  ORF Transcript_16244/g.38763 Transcript_16244/m.38763 type:complete len:240 (-) Transcript_16244:1334-2053(-)
MQGRPVPCLRSGEGSDPPQPRKAEANAGDEGRPSGSGRAAHGAGLPPKPTRIKLEAKEDERWCRPWCRRLTAGVPSAAPSTAGAASGSPWSACRVPVRPRLGPWCPSRAGRRLRQWSGDHAEAHRSQTAGGSHSHQLLHRGADRDPHRVAQQRPPTVGAEAQAQGRRSSEDYHGSPARLGVQHSCRSCRTWSAGLFPGHQEAHGPWYHQEAPRKWLLQYHRGIPGRRPSYLRQRHAVQP